MGFEQSIKASKRVNSYFKKFLKILPCNINDPRDVSITGILDMLRGTALNIEDLIKKKSLKDAQILIRTQTERFIKLKKLCDDPKFPLEFIRESERARLKYINIASSNLDEGKENPHYAGLKKATEGDLAESLKVVVAELDPEKSIWLLAKEAGLLHGYYSTFYRLFSEVSHCASGELDDCIAVREDNELQFVPYGFNCQDGLVPAILLSARFIVESMSVVSQIMELNIQNDLDDLRIWEN